MHRQHKRTQSDMFKSWSLQVFLSLFFSVQFQAFLSIVCFHSKLVSLWDDKVRKLPLNLWNSHQSNILESCLTWDEVSLHLDTSSFHADTKLELKLEISSIINVVRLDLFFWWQLISFSFLLRLVLGLPGIYIS